MATPDYDRAGGVLEFEQFVLSAMLAGSIAPLVVLAIATVAFANEIEDRTLANLTLSPIPRWQIVVPKLLAAITVAAPFIAVSAFITAYVAFLGDARAIVAVTVSAIVGVALYASAFVWLGLVTTQAIGIGLLYIRALGGILLGVRVGSTPAQHSSLCDRIDARTRLTPIRVGRSFEPVDGDCDVGTRVRGIPPALRPAAAPHGRAVASCAAAKPR